MIPREIEIVEQMIHALPERRLPDQIELTVSKSIAQCLYDYTRDLAHGVPVPLFAETGQQFQWKGIKMRVA